MNLFRQEKLLLKTMYKNNGIGYFNMPNVYKKKENLIQTYIKLEQLGFVKNSFTDHFALTDKGKEYIEQNISIVKDGGLNEY